MNLFTNEGNLSIYPSFINYWSREVITYNNDVRWRGEGGGEGGRRSGSRRGEGGGEGREEGGGEGGEKDGGDKRREDKRIKTSGKRKR